MDSEGVSMTSVSTVGTIRGYTSHKKLIKCLTIVSVLTGLIAFALVCVWADYYLDGTGVSRPFNAHLVVSMLGMFTYSISLLFQSIKQRTDNENLCFHLLVMTYNVMTLSFFLAGCITIVHYFSMLNLKHFISFHSWISMLIMAGLLFQLYIELRIIYVAGNNVPSIRAKLSVLHTKVGTVIYVLVATAAYTALYKHEGKYRPSLPPHAVDPLVKTIGMLLAVHSFTLLFAVFKSIVNPYRNFSEESFHIEDYVQFRYGSFTEVKRAFNYPSSTASTATDDSLDLEANRRAQNSFREYYSTPELTGPEHLI